MLQERCSELWELERRWIAEGEVNPLAAMFIASIGVQSVEGKILFRQIPQGAKLLAIGNLFRSLSPGSSWRVASLLEVNR